MKLTHTLAITVLLAAPAFAAPPPLSTGKEVVLIQHLTPEKPTLFLFLKPSSTMERSFAEGLEKDIAGRAGIQIIQLKTGDEPIAKKYEVKETPTGMVFDRRGRLLTRSSDAGEIRSALKKAAGVMRIDWAADDDPRMEEIAKRMGRAPGGGIMRTMTLQPDYLFGMMELTRKAHFSDGFLKRRTKEMVASYVSALNKCRYWVGSHARNLQLQGQDEADVDQLAAGHPEKGKFTQKELTLLAYVKVLTLEPAKVNDSDVEACRKAGWSDEEIFEATFDTALFAFYNRMADAYGLDYPMGGWLPEELRAKPEAATGK